MAYHIPVLLHQSIEGLNIDPNGIYVDVTFGGGGHSQEILKKLEAGRLIAFDQDAEAKKQADQIQHRSFTFVEANFRYLKNYLKMLGIPKVHGILADLGVSSYQFDTPDRGFSFRWEGDLDMRMNQSQQLNAQTVVNSYDKTQLIKLFKEYGELDNAAKLAHEILRERAIKPISNIDQLKKIAGMAQKGKVESQYLAKIFQAIRIEVNQEMEALKDFLHQSNEMLLPNGRLVVITYHSLEDRPVKNFINKGNIEGKDQKNLFGHVIRDFDPLNKKPIEADQTEIIQNNRARSAKLRIGIKRAE